MTPFDEDTNPLPLRRDPLRYGWWAWGILALALLAVPAACVSTTAAEPVLEPAEIHCNDEWCLVRKDTFVPLLQSMRRLIDRLAALEKICGWQK